ncbi:MAG: hypothetical protein Q8930_10390 [Bacillota bacterium]|nr:hypothetical protein [Bacillota bacterium]
MQCYKVKREFIDSEKRHQTAVGSIILAVFTTFVIVLAFVSQYLDDRNEKVSGIIFAAILIAGVGAAMIHYASVKLEADWKSYSVLIYDNYIEKCYKSDKPESGFRFNPLLKKGIVESRNISSVTESQRGLVIRAEGNSLTRIFVPRMTEGYEDIKNTLKSWKCI